VALFGSTYWAGLIDWLKDPVVAEGNIAPKDMDLFKICDDAGEVVEHVTSVLQRKVPVEPKEKPVVQPGKADAQ